MKKIIILALVAFMSLGASAQLISSSTVTYKKSEKSGYDRLGVSYSSIKFGDGDGSNAYSFDWTKGISVSSSMPLYIETGLGGTYLSGDYGTKFVFASIPVNVTYKLEVAKGIKIAPFAGITLQGNILGEDDESDWFDDYDAKRFTAGFQIGSNFEFGKFYVGVSYGTAFSDLLDMSDYDYDIDSKQKGVKASIGIVF